jgi:hypothetical protein
MQHWHLKNKTKEVCAHATHHLAPKPKSASPSYSSVKHFTVPPYWWSPATWQVTYGDQHTDWLGPSNASWALADKQGALIEWGLMRNQSRGCLAHYKWHATWTGIDSSPSNHYNYGTVESVKQLLQTVFSQRLSENEI